jgi:protein involved in polysaccharide export with SLBB domain
MAFTPRHGSTGPLWRMLMFATIALLVCATAAIAVDAPYAPGPGDVLDIEIYAGAERQEAFSATVSPAGSITAPLIGEFALKNQPLPELAKRLAPPNRPRY